MGQIRDKQAALNEYKRWLSLTVGDKYHEKLAEISDNEDEIQDAFYRDVGFGTSGIRALLGPGTNRINKYVVRRTTQGIANYLRKSHKPVSVVIGYDSRRGSQFFAYEAASVLRGNLIKPYLFESEAPVSLLSYAIRELKCDLGIMITASHNPKIYNGYKVFNSEGYQIIGDTPAEILKEIEQIDYFDDIAYENSSGIFKVPDSISESFCKKIAGMSAGFEKDVYDGFKVVYTPLHGAGGKYVSDVFTRAGVPFDVVPSQAEPDKEFKTCPVPNPEKIMAYDESFKYMDEHGGDLILATDPDTDRVGAAIIHDGMRTVLTGNQTGLLLLDYLCHLRPPKEGQMVIRSIASSPLAEKICAKFGLKSVTTLTGFKYVGDIIAKLEADDKLDEFYFAFEESDSYMVDPFIREKDGVSSALMIAEMAAFHKKRGKDLIERLYELYNEYGICVDKTRNYFFSGPAGAKAIQGIMDFFRSSVNQSIGGRNILKKTDYMQETGLPKSNVIELDLDDGSKMVIRPSGTEPVIKIYSFETCDFSDVDHDIADIVDRYKSVIIKED